MFRPRRRTVVSVAAAFAVLLGGALAVTLATGNSGGAAGGKVTDGNMVTYLRMKGIVPPSSE